eukprot:764855-Hanusia_phi.AAC.1
MLLGFGKHLKWFIIVFVCLTLIRIRWSTLYVQCNHTRFSIPNSTSATPSMVRDSNLPQLDYDHNDVAYLMSIRLGCPPEGGPRVVIDVGANKGYSLLRYGFLWGNLHFEEIRHHVKHLQWRSNMYESNKLVLYALEPTKSALVVLNELRRKTEAYYPFNLHGIGLSDHAGVAKFRTPYKNVGDEGPTMGYVPGRSEVLQEEVNITTLDIFWDREIRPKYPGKITYIKIDVEGFDAYVIRGMKSLLKAGHVLAFEFEFADSWKDGRTGNPESLDAIIKFLKDLDYHCFSPHLAHGFQTVFKAVTDNHPWVAQLSKVSRPQNIVCLHQKQRCYDRFLRSYVMQN